VNYVLYGCPESATFGPQAVLEDAELAYTLETVDITSGGSRTPEHLAINPAGYVPALKLEDGFVMYEAAAIMLYLADHHGLKDLAPGIDEVVDRDKFVRSLFYLTSTVQEAYKHYYSPARYTTEVTEAPHIKTRSLELALERWQVVEDDLFASGPCVLGDRYSLADIYVVMLASWHPDQGSLYECFPAIKRCRDLVAARPRLLEVVRLHTV
jgi:glutathione S-transferase